MLYFISSSHQPAFNLATEEYLLKNFDEDFFFLYRNSPALIVGKHQNTLAEINLEKTEQENIPVYRRLSGGGTVFHDEGNLNYCFIKKGEKGKLVNFQKYSQPIIDTLQKLHVNAKFEGKSDLTIAGKKFSGNASHVYKNKVMQHGTMLFSSDLEQLNQLLKVNPLKFKDRGVRSIRSKVTNISDYLSHPLSVEQFSHLILEDLQQKFPESKKFEFSSIDLKNVENLMSEKYDNWEWNYGYSPNYNFEKLSNFEGGAILELNLQVEKGIIKNLEVFGNCIENKQVLSFKKEMHHTHHNKESVNKVLNTLPINLYFKKITQEQLLSAFF
ncbi:lipoate--protein ligase [Labilibaculum filiforme]|uniref:lipoate--protein ligase n=1 Tax=Labilibaculum filiforme TaxID=1940526 RepID=A0A2N3HZW9_9BACT|nr:lipoate--protein ligase [Labilibaculum filiforme]PKQ63533.1 lipoate--protein ligase [Labilibaculum filiforme]